MPRICARWRMTVASTTSRVLYGERRSPIAAYTKTQSTTISFQRYRSAPFYDNLHHSQLRPRIEVHKMNIEQQPKNYSFKGVTEVVYQQISANSPHTYEQNACKWIWSDRNEVLKVIVESEYTFSVMLETDFEEKGLRDALRQSKRSTTIEFLNGFFFNDKVLRFFEDSDWLDFAEDSECPGETRVYARANEKRIFIRSKPASREVLSIVQCEIIGLSDRVLSAVSELGKQFDWELSRMERSRASWNEIPQEIQENRRAINIGFTASETPSAVVLMTVKERCSKAIWNSLVEFPYSFDFMIHHANALRKEPSVNLGYIALLIASNMNRSPARLYDNGYRLVSHEQDSDLFRSWVIGCIAAGRLANHYAQKLVYVRGVARTLATKIAETMTRLRELNLKIIKHVMGGSVRRELWRNVCTLDRETMFKELDSDWQFRVTCSNSSTMKQIAKYLNMFQSTPTFQLRLNVVKELLMNDRLTKLSVSELTKFRVWTRERFLFGDREVSEVMLSMKTHCKIARSTNEVPDHQQI